jgi:hypothetical protein
MPQLTKETLKKLQENKGILDLTEEEKDELVLMTKPGSNNPAEVCPPTPAKLLEMGKMSVEDARMIVEDYDAAVAANEKAKYNKQRAAGQVVKDNKTAEAAAKAKIISKGETPA